MPSLRPENEATVYWTAALQVRHELTVSTNTPAQDLPPVNGQAFFSFVYSILAFDGILFRLMLKFLHFPA